MRVFLARYAYWSNNTEHQCSEIIVAKSYTAAIDDIEDAICSPICYINVVELEVSYNQETGVRALSIPDEAGAIIMSEYVDEGAAVHTCLGISDPSRKN